MRCDRTHIWVFVVYFNEIDSCIAIFKLMLWCTVYTYSNIADWNGLHLNRCKTNKKNQMLWCIDFFCWKKTLLGLAMCYQSANKVLVYWDLTAVISCYKRITQCHIASCCIDTIIIDGFRLHRIVSHSHRNLKGNQVVTLMHQPFNLLSFQSPFFLMRSYKMHKHTHT